MPVRFQQALLSIQALLISIPCTQIYLALHQHSLIHLTNTLPHLQAYPALSPQLRQHAGILAVAPARFKCRVAPADNVVHWRCCAQLLGHVPQALMPAFAEKGSGIVLQASARTKMLN